MTETEHKVLENRLRRAAKRQGLVLVKSRSRDPRAIDYGGYMLADADTDKVVAGGLGSRQALTLTEVAEALLETAEKLETKGHAIQTFRSWLLQDRFALRGAIQLIEAGDIEGGLAAMRALETDLLAQQSS